MRIFAMLCCISTMMYRNADMSIKRSEHVTKEWTFFGPSHLACEAGVGAPSNIVVRASDVARALNAQVD